MILGPNLIKYENEIREAVYEYARSNYHTPPLLEEIDIEWFGEVFEVANMEKELHEDIIIDFKDKNILSKIKSEYDKFVILPDVWSKGVIPNTGPLYPRNEYDMDRQNIVFINGKVMELFCIGKDIFQYNHNRYTYTFYKSSECSELFESETPSMKVLWVYKGSHINNIKGNEDLWESTSSEDDYRFSFDMNNILTNEDINRVGVALHYPHMIFDYNKEVDDRPEVIIHGLLSMSNDSWFTPKWFNLLENEVFIHNEGVYFANTFIVIFDDDTYNIENTYTKDKDEIIEKIDKHTLRLHKDSKISKIVVFFTERVNKYPNVDSLYYNATRENQNAAIVLRDYKKYTNDLMTYMNDNPYISIEKIIDWGYKYDRDVLVAIQNLFSNIMNVNPDTEIKIAKKWKHYEYLKPKIIIEVNNKLNWYPSLFVNNLLFSGDYKTITNADYTAIVIDPELFFRIVDRNNQLEEYHRLKVVQKIPKNGELPPYIPPSEVKDKWQDIDWIKRQVQTIVDKIKVVFVPYRAISEDIVSRQSGRMFRTPIFRGELVTDLAGYDENSNIFCGSLFVNGFLTTENNKTNKILRWLDDVNIFGCGELNFTLTDKESPSNEDVYNSKSDYITSNSMQLLINRVNEKIIGTNRIFLGNVSEHVIDYAGADIPKTIGKIPFKPYHTIAFDKYGIECTDYIGVLSKQYVNFDYMYNYVVGNGLEEEMTVSLNCFTLRDVWNEFDLEIDEDRINKSFNKGSYNENAILDENVRALFNPNKPDATRAIPIRLKSNRNLLSQKILSRYWLPFLGKGVPSGLADEVSVLNGYVISMDGTTLGDSGLDNVTDWIVSDTIRGDRRLIEIFGGADILTDLLTESGVSYIDYESVVDSKELYRVNVPDKYNTIEKIDIGSWCMELHTKIKGE